VGEGTEGSTTEGEEDAAEATAVEKMDLEAVDGMDTESEQDEHLSFQENETNMVVSRCRGIGRLVLASWEYPSPLYCLIWTAEDSNRRVWLLD